MSMRLGLFGGTFDPVHYGHLVLAEQCREQCALDEVWFLPAGSPPHKADAAITDGKHRAEMLELATAGMPRFRVNRMELSRAGKTYTVDTLTQLHTEDAGRELFFLIGADSLGDLPTWRQPQRISELATIVAVNRGERPLPDVAAICEQANSTRHHAGHRPLRDGPPPPRPRRPQHPLPDAARRRDVHRGTRAVSRVSTKSETRNPKAKRPP
jgi:nicotinate-nucleotide adenylyltransferase